MLEICLASLFLPIGRTSYLSINLGINTVLLTVVVLKDFYGPSKFILQTVLVRNSCEHLCELMIIILFFGFHWNVFISYLDTAQTSRARRAFQIDVARCGGHFLQETPLISHYSLSLSPLLQETLTDASRTLYTALDGKVYFKQVTVVVPDGWTATRCRVRVGEPREGTSFQVRGKGEQCLLLDMHRISFCFLAAFLHGNIGNQIILFIG